MSRPAPTEQCPPVPLPPVQVRARRKARPLWCVTSKDRGGQSIPSSSQFRTGGRRSPTQGSRCVVSQHPKGQGQPLKTNCNAPSGYPWGGKGNTSRAGGGEASAAAAAAGRETSARPAGRSNPVCARCEKGRSQPTDRRCDQKDTAKRLLSRKWGGERPAAAAKERERAKADEQQAGLPLETNRNRVVHTWCNDNVTDPMELTTAPKSTLGFSISVSIGMKRNGSSGCSVGPAAAGLMRPSPKAAVIEPPSRWFQRASS